VRTLKQYFSRSENILDTSSPCLDWKRGVSSSSSHHYNKLKRQATNTILPSCLNSVSQNNYFRTNGNLYELMLYSLTDFSVKCDVHDLVHLDIYHSTFVTELNFPLKRSNLSCNISFGRHLSGD
jgi:hypothetical protein